MINELELSYIQSWKYGLFEFVPGVNIITGTSNSGKTTIVRGLKLVVKNRPSGDALISNFKKKKKTPSHVTISFNDGTVTREKSSKLNQYILNGDEKNPYKALRTDVPDTISNLTNMSDLNFQLQHEPYFLLNESPGQIAKKFNELANLQIMTAALQAANGMTRSITSDLNSSVNAIQGLENQLESLKWLDSAHKIIKNGLTIKSELVWIETSKAHLHNQIDKLIAINEELESLENIDEVSEMLKIALANQEAYEKLIDKIGELRELIKSAQGIDRQIEFTNRGLNKTKDSFDSLMKELGVCPLCGSKV